MQSADQKTFKIISSIILVQGGILAFWIYSSENFLDYMGFTSITHISYVAWLFSACLVAGYVWGAASISTVREHMLKFNKLKYMALAGAIVSGIFE